MLRIYEKRLQLLSQAHKYEGVIDPTWVRVECEVKPGDKRGRERLGKCSPVEAWGFSKWGPHFLELITGVSVPRQVFVRKKMNDSYSAVRHMALQYRRQIGSVLLNEPDGWAGFQRFVLETWRDADGEVSPNAFEVGVHDADGPVGPLN